MSAEDIGQFQPMLFHRSEGTMDVFDKRIAELVADHPDGALFRSLPAPATP